MWGQSSHYHANCSPQPCWEGVRPAEKQGAGALQTAEPESSPAVFPVAGSGCREGSKGQRWREPTQLCPCQTLPHGKAGPRWKTLLQNPLCRSPGHKILPPPPPPKTHMKPYLEAVGVPIAFTDGVQGVFVVQRRPLVSRHLHGEIGKQRCSVARGRRKGGGRRARKEYAPSKAASSTGELNPEWLWGSKVLNKCQRKVMESNKGRSQKLSKARTRLAFPRGRVVQPPLQPGLKPVPPPPAPQRVREPPPPRARNLRKAGSRENGFSP